MSTWHVILLGLIEGLTEFLPVSSTGHLLLAGHFLGFQSPGKTFEVLIQLGAILAILSVYAGKLMQLLVDFPSDARTRRFVLAVLIAFLPAAVIGATLHKYIKGYLFESPALVCTSLIVGGIVLLAVDKMRLPPRYIDVMDYPVAMALVIGFAQCLAMIPGVSRSGATIVGGAASGRGQALRHRVHVLPGHADHGRRLRLRPLQELGDPGARGRQEHRAGLRRCPSSPAWWSCAICSISSAGTALRRSPGGGLSSAAWGSALWPCSADSRLPLSYRNSGRWKSKLVVATVSAAAASTSTAQAAG